MTAGDAAPGGNFFCLGVIELRIKSCPRYSSKLNGGLEHGEIAGDNLLRTGDVLGNAEIMGDIQGRRSATSDKTLVGTFRDNGEAAADRVGSELAGNVDAAGEA